MKESEIGQNQSQDFKKGMALETQLNSCNPENSILDRMIFQEITGNAYEESDDNLLMLHNESYEAP